MSPREATAAMFINLAGIYFMEKKVPVGMGTRNPQVMPSQAFKTKDSWPVIRNTGRFVQPGQAGMVADKNLSDGRTGWRNTRRWRLIREGDLQ
jgi:hypothetical protein